jgi:hypothetical protein
VRIRNCSIANRFKASWSLESLKPSVTQRGGAETKASFSG